MRTLLIATAPLLVLAACSDNSPANNVAAEADSNMAMAEANASAGMGMGMPAAPTLNTADAYVANAAIGDMYEIESSKLALEKSQSADIKKFAQMMVADHTATTAKIKAAIAGMEPKIVPPAALDPRRQDMIDDLKGKSGEDFDKAYLDQQTAAHEEALNLHGGFAREGDNEALKKIAGEITPKVQQHLDRVKALDKGGADEAK